MLIARVSHGGAVTQSFRRSDHVARIKPAGGEFLRRVSQSGQAGLVGSLLAAACTGLLAGLAPFMPLGLLRFFLVTFFPSARAAFDLERVLPAAEVLEDFLLTVRLRLGERILALAATSALRGRPGPSFIAAAYNSS